MSLAPPVLERQPGLRPLGHVAMLAIMVAMTWLQASATITPVSYFRMGEDDPDPPIGGNVQILRNHFGTAHLSSSSSIGAGNFTHDVAPEAAARVGSTQGFGLWEAGLLGAYHTGTDNCGIEGWVKCSPSTSTREILYNGSPGTNGYGIALAGDKFQARIGSTMFGSAPVVTGAWTHVALVRSGGTATFYVDGVNCGSSTSPVAAATGQMFVGGAPFLIAVDEVRTFTFNAGEFTPDDLLRRAAEISIEQPAGTVISSGGTRDFGVLEVGVATSLDFTVSSSGVTDLSGIAASILGPDAGDFSITSSPPSTVAAGASATFTVQFSPTKAGRRTALLRLANNDPDESPFEIVVTGSTPGRELAVEGPTSTRLATGTVSVWGSSPTLKNVPPALSGVTSVAFGNAHLIARRDDGSVVAWGGTNLYGETTIPPELPPVTTIAAGWNHNLAITSGGSVVAWGRNNAGQTDVPADLSNVIAVAAGRDHSVACRADGTVVAWGSNALTQTTIPADLAGVVAVSAGEYHTLALKSNGAVVAWGLNANGQTNVPANLSGIVAVAAGGSHSLALRSNGFVTGWGSNTFGQASAPGGTFASHAIAAGRFSSMALRGESSLTAWGFTPSGIPPIVRGIRAIALHDQALAVIGDSIVDFGPQMIGFPTAAKTITLRNPGTEPLRVSSVTISGTCAADYSITAPMLPLDLAPSASVDLPVTFTPLGSGNRFATLRIASDDPARENFFVSLAGTGITAAPDIAVFEGAGTDGQELGDNFLTHAFPETVVNGQSSVRTFTILNKGYLNLTGIKLSKISGYPDDFVLGAPSVASLAYGESTTFTVTFSPKASGARNTFVRVSSNDTDENPFEIKVTGNAVGAEIAVLSPAGVSLETGKVTGWGFIGEPWHEQIAAGLIGGESIAVGDSFALGLRHDGTVTGYGENGEGQALPPEGLNEVISVAAGFHSGYALKADGTVVAWGANDKGQTNVPAGLSGVTKIVAASHHVMALKSDGTVVSWGALSSSTVPMPAGLAGVVDIATSAYCAAALKSDGSIAVWGRMNSNQNLVPSGLTGVIRIVAGDEFVAALKSDGTVTAWGGSVPSDHQFGAPYGLSDVVDIVARRDAIMARRADGSLVIWGQYGTSFAVPAGVKGVSAMAAGYPDFATVSVPVENFGTRPVSLSSDPKTFTIRNSGSLPLDIAGVDAVAGHTGDFTVDATGTAVSIPAGGQTTFSVRFTPAATGLRSATLRISSSDRDERSFDILLTGEGVPHVPIISLEESSGIPLRNGIVREFGTPDSFVTLTPMPAGLEDVRAIDAGSWYTLALKPDKTVAAWGNQNNDGIRPPYDLKDVASIAAAPSYALALKDDGGIVAWGKVGDIESTMPSGLSGVTQLSAGTTHAMALLSDGTVVAWGGRNDYGERNVPPGLAGVTAVAAGAYHCVALKSDGTVASWGKPATAPPAGLTGIVAVAAAGDHSLALKGDGTVIGWGSSSDAAAFQIPGGLSGVVAIATAPAHSLALKHDGTVIGWGSNTYGQLAFPPGLTGVKAIAAGSGRSVLLTQAHSDFGIRGVVANGTVKTYVVRNQGSQPLHITGVDLAGDQAADFTIDTTGMSSTLPAGTGVTTFKVSFSPGASGFRSTVLKILNDDPDAPAFDLRLTGTGVVPATPREAWRLAHFGSGVNAGDAADNADPNRNGISNLLEYALGGDPIGAPDGSSILPRCGISDTGTLEFKFTRDLARTDLTLTIQGSDDLASPWIDLARSSLGAAFLPLVEGVSVDESETGTGSLREVTLGDAATVTDPLKRRRFLRLLVTGP